MAEDFRLYGYLEVLGIQNVDKHLNNLRAKLASLPPIDIGTGKLADVNKEAKKTENQIKSTTRQIQLAATSAQDFGDKAALALRRFTAFSIAAGATYGSLRAVIGGLKNAARFERELVKVQQVTNATAVSLNSLQNEIARLGTSLAAPASELVDVSRILSQAGLDIEQVKTILESISRTRLAGTFGDAQDTTEGIIAVMGQFKVPASEVERSLALINATAAKYAVEAEDLIAAIKRTGGAFSVASSGIVEGNEALAEFNALISAVIQTTRQAPENVATGLRTIIGRLQRDSTVDFFNQRGVNLRDAEGRFVGVFNALNKIYNLYRNISPLSEDFSKALEVVGGARQYGVTVPLIKEFALAQEILNKSLKDQAEFIKQSELPLQTVEARLQALGNAWNNLSRDVFNSPVFQFLAHQALDLSNSLVKVLDNLSGILPLLAIVGGAKLARTVYSEGVLGVAKTRLFTGHGQAGIIHRAGGGYIPGVGYGDKVPIMAEPGEFVIRKNAAKAIGADRLHLLNNIDKYAMGGFVNGKLRGYVNGGLIGNQTFRADSEQFLQEGRELGISTERLTKIINKIGNTFTDVEKANFAYQQFLKQQTQGAKRQSVSRGGGTNSGNLNIPISKADLTSAVVANAREVGKVTNNSKGVFLSQAKSLGIDFPSTTQIVREVTKATRSIVDPTERAKQEQKLYSGAIRAAQYPVGNTQYSVGRRQYADAAQKYVEDQLKQNQLLLPQRGLVKSGVITTPEAPLPSVPPYVSKLRTKPQVAYFDNAVAEAAERAQQRNYVEGNIERNRRVRDRSNYGGAGPTLLQEEFGVRGRTGSDAAEYIARRGLKGLKVDTGGASVIPQAVGRNGYVSSQVNIRDIQHILNPPSVGQRLNNYIRSDNFRGFIGGKSRFGFSGVGRALGNTTGLGLAAIASDTLLPKLGFGNQASSTISGILGGAAAGSLLGPKGAAVGAIYGGANAFINASQQDELNKAQDELTKRTHEVNEAFKDLSSSGLKKLNEAIRNRLNAAENLQEIEGRGFGARVSRALGLASPKDFVTSGNTIGGVAGLGFAGLAGAGGIAALGVGGLGAGAGIAGFQGLRAGYRALTGYEYKKGESLGYDFGLRFAGGFTDENERERAESIAEKNKEFAGQSRESIKRLLRIGRSGDVSESLLLGSISDRADLLRGNRRGQVSNAQTEILPKLQEEIAKEFNFQAANRRIDDFQNRLAQSNAQLDLFSIAVGNSANDVQNQANIAQGNYSTNKNFNNLFTSIEGLTRNQITGAIGGLQSFSNTYLDKDIVGTLKSLPTLNRIDTIISDAFKADGGRTESTSVLIDRIINSKRGPLSNLPQQIKDQLSGLFDGLEEGDVQDVIGGRNKEFYNDLKEIGQAVKEFAINLQEAQNKLLEMLQQGTNTRTGLLTTRGGLDQNYQNALNAGLSLRDRVRGEAPDAGLGIFRAQRSIGALTGGTADPNEILNNIRALQDEKERLESGSLTIGKYGPISEVNAALNKNKQALDQLAQSALGLAEIQEELAYKERQRSESISLIENDVLGGNRRANFRGQAALQLFEQTGSLAQVARRFSNTELQAGINRRRQEISATGTPKELEDFNKNVIGQLARQGIGIGFLNQNLGGKLLNNVNDDRINELRDLIDQSTATQLDAIKAQRTLLDENIRKFDDVLQNKFINGVNDLGKVIEGFKVPDIKVDLRHEHNITINGLDVWKQTEPYFKAIAEQIGRKLIIQMTEGREGNGLEAGFAGKGVSNKPRNEYAGGF